MSTSTKKWRCTVCNYIHEGENPPEKCPVCGVGPEKFVLLEEEVTESMEEQERKQLQKVLFNTSYGLYVITSKKEDKINGQCTNSFFQVTSQPLQGAVGINHENLTAEYIKESGVFAVSFLGQEDHDKVMRFGYRSGREFDKFEGLSYESGEKTGCPVLKDAIGYVECEVDWQKSTDVGTHMLYVAKVVGGKNFKEDAEPMTYAYYRKTRKR